MTGYKGNSEASVVNKNLEGKETDAERTLTFSQRKEVKLLTQIDKAA